MIERRLHKEIDRLAASFPALVMTGARQTGKTTLLKHVFPNHHYVTLDLPSDALLAENDPDRFFALHPFPIIIDEIQYAPALFRHIKLLIDRNRRQKGIFILTGSQKFNLMKEVSDSLAGRCGVLELESLSYSELSQSTAKVEGYQNLLGLLARGGMPELWVEPSIRARDFFTGYMATYLERDVRQILSVANLRDFERFMRACAIRSGQIVNKSDLARDIGITEKTVANWLGVLSASNQILTLEPWFGSLSKRLTKSPKLFFADTGLLTFLLGLDELTLGSYSLLGSIWETFVFSEIRKCLPFLHGVPTVWFYRDQTQQEVDFIVETGTHVMLIECKYTENTSLKDAAGLTKLKMLFEENSQMRGKIISRTVVARPSNLSSKLPGDIDVIHAFELAEYLIRRSQEGIA